MFDRSYCTSTGITCQMYNFKVHCTEKQAVLVGLMRGHKLIIVKDAQTKHREVGADAQV